MQFFGLVKEAVHLNLIDRERAKDEKKRFNEFHNEMLEVMRGQKVDGNLKKMEAANDTNYKRMKTKRSGKGFGSNKDKLRDERKRSK